LDFITLIYKFVSVLDPVHVSGEVIELLRA
jgi:hypothetical protein